MKSITSARWGKASKKSELPTVHDTSLRHALTLYAILEQCWEFDGQRIVRPKHAAWMRQLLRQSQSH